MHRSVNREVLNCLTISIQHKRKEDNLLLLLIFYRNKTKKNSYTLKRYGGIVYKLCHRLHLETVTKFNWIFFLFEIIKKLNDRLYVETTQRKISN